VEVYRRLRLAEAGARDYRFYGGTIFIEGGGTSGPVTVSPFRVPHVVGGRVLWETPMPWRHDRSSYPWKDARAWFADFELGR
jgi:hypothetical protein